MLYRVGLFITLNAIPRINAFFLTMIMTVRLNILPGVVLLLTDGRSVDVPVWLEVVVRFF